MEKVFNFIQSLKPSFFEVLGFPTIKVYSEIIEVCFSSGNTISDLSIFELSGPDEFKFFPHDSLITYVFTFYISEV